VSKIGYIEITRKPTCICETFGTSALPEQRRLRVVVVVHVPICDHVGRTLCNATFRSAVASPVTVNGTILHLVLSSDGTWAWHYSSIDALYQRSTQAGRIYRSKTTD
jgi:hypothetical protein